MKEYVLTYIFLFSVIVLLGHFFRKSIMPLSIILVVFGILLSLLPFIPTMRLNPELVLDFFLPLLIYQISAFSSWTDIRKQIRSIASLSIGHVVFITLIVAVVIHTLIPQMGWPLAFVLGAIISPPDDVAIVSIGEKIRIPERIFLILEGEGMFNDAAALTLFSFALTAALTHTFSATNAIVTFVLIIIGEALYGLFLGNVLGKIRQKIANTRLHMIVSLMTPFLAFIPPSMCGGTGVLATAVVGFIIGNHYSVRFTPEFRLMSFGFWPALSFAIESIIFLLVGLNVRSIYDRISVIPLEKIILFVSCIVLTVIIGRFIWVYSSVLISSKWLFPKKYRANKPTFKSTFLVSWAGMRGGISLAAALAIPTLYFQVDGVDLRDLIIFLVLCIIMVTLILQGFTLPFIMKKLGLDQIGETEKYREHVAAIDARMKMLKASYKRLKQYQDVTKENEQLLEDVNFYTQYYKGLLKKYKKRITDHEKVLCHKDKICHDEEREVEDATKLSLELIKIEKKILLKLWREEKINLRTRNKLLTLLDHQAQRVFI